MSRPRRLRADLIDLVEDPRHGPLPALLLGLTVLTGVVDAVSLIGLGHVFVANMTGNVVFAGLALAGAPGFALDASLVALAGFLLGAAGGGVAIGRLGERRGALLRGLVTVEGVLLAVATVVVALVGEPLSAVPRDTAAFLCAVALGLQNAGARRLAVPDLTTTVLTMTLTGIAADLRASRKRVEPRRLLAVASMFVGAVAGTLVVRFLGLAVTLGVATVVAVAVAVAAAAVSRRSAPWQHPG